jgi:hypothetical protein
LVAEEGIVVAVVSPRCMARNSSRPYSRAASPTGLPASVTRRAAVSTDTPPISMVLSVCPAERRMIGFVFDEEDFPWENIFPHLHVPLRFVRVSWLQ